VGCWLGIWAGGTRCEGTVRDAGREGSLEARDEFALE
jgi:hypothetical protein